MAPQLSLAAFNTTCTKAEGRDKLARFIQYLARFLIGCTTTAKVGTPLKTLNDNARSLMVQLAGARRTHRWCKEIPVIQAIPKSLSIQDPVDRCLEVLQKGTLATFMIIDHIGWLKQLKILKGGKRAGTGTIQLGLTWFCFSNFVAAIIQGKKLKQLYDEKEKKDNPAARSACMQTIAKHMLLVLQTAHLSRTYETNDMLVGFAGMITSFQDLMPQWPQEEKKAQPDAKAKAQP